MDVLGYTGKRVIVTGAASGIGAATPTLLVELGAEVHTIDLHKPEIGGIVSFTECDLRDPHSIDATVDRIGSVVNMLFNCAGVSNTHPPLDVMLVNFCGLRQLTERVIELMLVESDSAIASVASLAGMAWRSRLERLRDLVATPDFASAKQWCQAHPSELERAYGFSKEAVNVYTATRSATLAASGIRLNCLNPGVTDTPMIAEYEKVNGKAFTDDFPVPLGRYAQPHEQAWPLLFLNSPRASFVTGAHLDADGGLRSAMVARPIDPPVA